MKFRHIATLLATVVLIAAAGIVFTLRSDWLREKVRERIVFEAERATGGKLELGAFRFEWETLTAVLDNLTLHGTEPAGDPPLFHVKQATIRLEIISLLEKQFRLARLVLEDPESHLVVEPDGNINLKPPRKSDIGEVVNLKIGEFALRNGVIRVDLPGRPQRTFSGSARGKNVTAAARYDAAAKAYAGVVSVTPVHVEAKGIRSFEASLAAPFRMERNRIISPKVSLRTDDSQVDVTDFVVTPFIDPVVTGQFEGTIAMQEVDRVFGLVNFRHTGKVAVRGSARYAGQDDFRIAGGAQGSDLGYGRLAGLTASTNFEAGPGRVKLAALRLAALGGTLEANGDVRDLERIHLTGTLDGLDARALTDFAGVKPLPWNGLLSGPFEASGNVSEQDLHSLQASGRLAISPAPGAIPVHGELAARFDGTTMGITINPSWLELPSSRADVSGVPGDLRLRVETRDVNELRPLVALPEALRSATGTFDGTLTGPLDSPSVAGRATLNKVVWRVAGKDARKRDIAVDSVEGAFRASDSGVTIDKGSLVWNGMRVEAKGSLSFTDWNVGDSSPMRADFELTGGDVTRLLALAERTDLPLSGGLTAKGQVSGTMGDPRITGTFRFANGTAAGEPFDAVTLDAKSPGAGVYQLTAAVQAGAKRLNVAGRLEHSRLTLTITGNGIPLNQIEYLRSRATDIRGTARVNLSAALRFGADGTPEAVEDIAGEIGASGLALGTRTFGEARLTATTKNGVMTGHFTSNTAGASLDAEGTVGLSGDYPLEAKMTLAGLRLANIAALVNPGGPKPAADDSLDGSIEGIVTLRGPAKMPDQLTAEIDLTRVEIDPPRLFANQSLTLVNEGPVKMSLAKSVVRMESAHFRGPDTTLEVSGQASLNDANPLDLRIQGEANIAGVAQAEKLDPDLTAAGELSADAMVRGAFANPDISGRIEVRDGEFRLKDFSNGLTRVHGAALFSGTPQTGLRATIQTLTGESGGGTVDAAGFVALTNGVPSFRLEAKGRGIRVRYPAGVSSVSDADLTLAGTRERSEATGKVTVRRVAINPRSDAASILADASSPIRTPAAGAGLAANMNLDVQIETAVDVAFETNMAQSIEANASLRLRGTLSSPALVGRVNVTHGELVFFGNKYTIAQGALTFSDPTRIVPVLSVDLETKARGVDVTLTVSGPISKLNVSYRSDPPLQFADVVALLATGRTPTAATLATDTGQSQNFRQIGAQALLGQALANPAADRLQRFFGVSRIKIDPQLTGITGSPEARLTIEQEVTPELLFTYVSDVSSTSTQLIRVEWNFNRNWGAILTREENGYVGLDFAYRKRFK